MPTNQSDSEASKWLQRFENRKQKQDRLFKDARKYFDIMYAVQNTDKISAWKSKVYVPVLASKAWDLIARMSDVLPLFNITIVNELEMDDEAGNFVIPQVVVDRQKRIEAKLARDYRCMHEQPMKLRVFDPLVDAVVAGTGYAYVPWTAYDKKTKARKYDELGTMDNTKTVTKTEKTGRNDFKGINFFNVFVADAPSFFESPYIIVRDYKPLVDMKRSGMYKNLDQVATDGAYDPDFTQYNDARNRVVNEDESIDKDDTVDTVTYYNCFERTEKGIKFIVYAEGQTDGAGNSTWVEIKAESYPYWHDMYPVVPFYCRKKSYGVFGESLFENNRTLQSATNDLFNHYLDNWNLSVDGMIMYEDGSLTSDFIVEPGGEITFSGEPPKQFKFPEPNPQQLSVVMGVIEKGVENATFSQYVSGVPNSASDKTQGTKYGVQSITEAATTKIGFFRDNFKQSMKVVGQIWLSNLQQFADSPEEIRRRENGREVPDIVLPSDYQGEMELDIDDDSMVPISKAEKREMNAQFVNEILGIQKAAITQTEIFKDKTDIPRLNFKEIFEDTAELYSKKDYNRYLLDNTNIPEEQPVDNTREYLNINYKDAPADIKAQIEEKFGLQPSAMHDSDLAHQAIKMGQEEAMIENGGMNGPEQPAGSPATGMSNSPTGA